MKKVTRALKVWEVSMSDGTGREFRLPGDIRSGETMLHEFDAIVSMPIEKFFELASVKIVNV